MAKERQAGAGHARVHHLQAAQLHHDEEQAQRPRAHRDEEVLPLGPHPHAPQGDPLGHRRVTVPCASPAGLIRSMTGRRWPTWSPLAKDGDQQAFEELVRRDLRRHLHARAPAHRRRGGRPGRGAGGLPAGLPGPEAVPRRRPVHDLAVPDHRQLRRHPRCASAARHRHDELDDDVGRSSTTGPSRSRAVRADARRPARPPRRALARAAAPAAGGRRAPRRLRPAPRGDRRRARASRSRRPRSGCTGPGASCAEAVPAAGRTSRTRSRPMRCDDIGEVARRRPPTARSRSTDAARRHVEQCLRCQAELVQYRKLLRALRTLRTEVLEPAPGLLAEILAHLEEAGERHAVRSLLSGRRVAYLGGLAAATAAGAARRDRARHPLPGAAPAAASPADGGRLRAAVGGWTADATLVSRVVPPKGSSSIGRAPVSKTGGWGFESLLPCSLSIPSARRRLPHDGDEPRDRSGCCSARAQLGRRRRSPRASAARRPPAPRPKEKRTAARGSSSARSGPSCARSPGRPGRGHQLLDHRARHRRRPDRADRRPRLRLRQGRPLPLRRMTDIDDATDTDEPDAPDERRRPTTVDAPTAPTTPPTPTAAADAAEAADADADAEPPTARRPTTRSIDEDELTPPRSRARTTGPAAGTSCTPSRATRRRSSRTSRPASPR